MMDVSFLFLAATFDRHSVLERVIRYLFLTSGTRVVGALLFLAMRYGSNLEYRFDVASLLIDWVTLIAADLLLSFLFWRAATPAASERQQLEPSTGTLREQL